jgi:general secretion pathway protein G
MQAIRNAKKGFTLVEILIVVIILGILAAIVIPQFSNASTEARKNSARSLAQTIRSQIELYKLQHKDVLPVLVGSNATGTHWAPLTTQTGAAGGAPTSATDTFGPYLQQVPSNPLITNPTTALTVVEATDAASPPTFTGPAGFVYDQAANGTVAATGKFWVTDDTGNALLAN